MQKEADKLPIQREAIATSLNGRMIFLNPAHTNIHLHVLENPQILSLVKEVVEQSVLEGENVAIEKDLGRVVGVTNCVTTDESDDIIYAKRKKRDTFSRFVKNKQAQPTNFVTVILHEAEDGYELWSAWCGQPVPMVRDSKGVLHGDKAFWENHALLYDPEIIQPDTVSTVRPW